VGGNNPRPRPMPSWPSGSGRRRRAASIVGTGLLGRGGYVAPGAARSAVVTARYLWVMVGTRNSENTRSRS
jgi:hypothetical protein